MVKTMFGGNNIDELLSKLENDDDTSLFIFNLIKELYYELYITKKCPICENEFSSFLPFNGEIIKCPYCNSVPRQRLFYLFFKNKTSIFRKNCKVLIFNPEYPIYSAFKQNNKIDLTSVSCRFDNSSLIDNQVNIEKLHYKNNFFDLIYIDNKIKNRLNSFKASKELYRVIKPHSRGGLLVLRSPALDNLTKDSLELAGFTISEYSYKQLLNDNEIKECCTKTDSKVYVCKK